MDLIRLLRLTHEGDEAAALEIAQRYASQMDGDALLDHHRTIMVEAGFLRHGTISISGSSHSQSWSGTGVPLPMKQQITQIQPNPQAAFEALMRKAREDATLTWTGYEFLDTVRNDNVWNKTKQKVLKPGTSWTVSLLAEVAKLEIKKQLGLP